MIHVLAHYADRGRSGDYRVRFPAHVVSRRDDLGIRVETADHVNAHVTTTDGRVDVRNVFIPSGVEVLVFSRPTSRVLVETIIWLRHRRPDLGICVDIDDEEHDIDSFPIIAHLKRAAAQADVITCSSQRLADQFGYDSRRTFVIPTGVPELMLEQPARTLTRRRAHTELNRDRTIGSVGRGRAFMLDAAVLNGALGEIVGADVTDGRRVSYRHVGPSDRVAASLHLNDTSVECTGGKLSPDLYRVALSEIDIALLPVNDQDFARRSGLTAIEFAAAGVPVVATATPAHTELIQSGMPMWPVAQSRHHWVRAVRSLLSYDDAELKTLAQAHREYVRRYQTIESRATQWADAWRETARITRELRNDSVTLAQR